MRTMSGCLILALVGSLAGLLGRATCADQASEKTLDRFLALLREHGCTARLSIDAVNPPVVDYLDCGRNKLSDTACAQILSAGVPITNLELRGAQLGPKTAKSLLHQTNSLHALRLDEGEISAEVLRALAGVKWLHRLHLTGCALSPEAFQEIGKIKTLGFLALTHSKQLGSARLDFLASLSELSELNLAYSRLPADLSPLKRLTNLTELTLQGVVEADEVLGALAGNRVLRGVWLSEAKVTARGLGFLAGADVRILNLNLATVDLEMARAVARLSLLHALDLSSATLRDGAFAEICKCSELERLNLLGARVRKE